MRLFCTFTVVNMLEKFKVDFWTVYFIAWLILAPLSFFRLKSLIGPRDVCSLHCWVLGLLSRGIPSGSIFENRDEFMTRPESKGVIQACEAFSLVKQVSTGNPGHVAARDLCWTPCSISTAPSCPLAQRQLCAVVSKKQSTSLLQAKQHWARYGSWTVPSTQVPLTHRPCFARLQVSELGSYCHPFAAAAYRQRIDTHILQNPGSVMTNLITGKTPSTAWWVDLGWLPDPCPARWGGGIRGSETTLLHTTQPAQQSCYLPSALPGWTCYQNPPHAGERFNTNFCAKFTFNTNNSLICSFPNAIQTAVEGLHDLTAASLRKFPRTQKQWNTVLLVLRERENNSKEFRGMNTCLFTTHKKVTTAVSKVKNMETLLFLCVNGGITADKVTQPASLLQFFYIHTYVHRHTHLHSPSKN